MAARSYGEYSGLVRALELVGERWALLLVRELLLGPRRYGELARALPRIPSNILAARLKELQANGLIRRIPRIRQIVYELTPEGRALEAPLLAMDRWGAARLGERDPGQLVTVGSLTTDLRAAFRPEVAAGLPATRYSAEFGGLELHLDVDGPALRFDADGADATAVDLAFSAATGFQRLLAGELSPREAVERELVSIRSGSMALLGRFSETFRLAA